MFKVGDKVRLNEQGEDVSGGCFGYVAGSVHEIVHKTTPALADRIYYTLGVNEYIFFDSEFEAV